MTDKKMTTIEKLKSQIGDDIQHIFDHEALFKLAVNDIESLTAENKKMREALKSFIGGSTETFHGETSGAKGGTSLLVTWDEIRAARAALKGGE